MKYKVFVGYSWETNDMGIANHGTSQKEVPTEDVVPGYDLFAKTYDHPGLAQVVSFDGCTLVFRHGGQTISLQGGHTWNSPMYREDNPYIYESGGYLIMLKADADPEKEEEYTNRAVELLNQMRKNAAEEGWQVWKNIPLAREYYDILNNKLPFRGKEMEPTGIVFLIDCLFLEDLLPQRDVPRLCLEFLQLRKLADAQEEQGDTTFDEVLGVQEADKIQNQLDFYIDPHVSMEWWVEYTGAHLLFDPVERTPKWEEIIYEVEAECDRRLQGEPRGMGFCFSYWATKQAVLAQHGIDWSSPSAMNPRVMFD